MCVTKEWLDEQFFKPLGVSIAKDIDRHIMKSLDVTQGLVLIDYEETEHIKLSSLIKQESKMAYFTINQEDKMLTEKFHPMNRKQRRMRGAKRFNLFNKIVAIREQLHGNGGCKAEDIPGGKLMTGYYSKLKQQLRQQCLG